MESCTVPLHNNEDMCVKPLFTICIEFVANNITLVDSLENFPDIIGKKIFQHCLTTEIFASDNSETQHVIRLFVNAYGKEFMESLCIHNQKLASEFGECLSILCLPLTHLDLSGCLFGDSEDILKIFADMNNLQVLNLAHNELSDDGFRSMLARNRMYKTGFRALEKLDISTNIVSLRVLKSFLGLPNIKVIRVSIASSLKQSDENFVNEWKKIVAQKGYHITQTTDSIVSSIKTRGWGAKIVKIWERKASEWEIKRIEKIDKKSQSFYSDSLKRIKLDVLRPSTEAEHYITFVYLRRKTHKSDDDTKSVNDNNKRCLPQIISEDKMKRKRTEAYQSPRTEDEMEILKLYMKKQ